LDKHAHLQFYTADKRHVLSFVDYRRFGRWEEGADWGRDRGPDPVYEHDAFRLNVLNSLHVCARILALIYLSWIKKVAKINK
jgi:endonuclease VIII-like 1